MALVIFPRNHWYAPNGQLFRKSATKKGPPIEVPEHLLVKNEQGKYKYLPSSAVVVSDDYVTPTPASKRGSIDTLSEFAKSATGVDESREMTDAADFGKAEALAQIAIQDKAQKFQDELAEEAKSKNTKSKEKR